MIGTITSTIRFGLVLGVIVLHSTPGFAQVGAKALFNDPLGERIEGVRAWSYPQFVGIQYWLENARGERFIEARNAGVGVPLRLHIRSNVAGYLAVWMADQPGPVELTPLTDGHHGYLLTPTITYVVPGTFTAGPRNGASKALILFARSQTEQPDAGVDVVAKIRRLTTSIARDGARSIVREADSSTAGHIGTYVVHREGDQAAAEIEIAWVGK